jgi:hypothetical protein
LPVAENSTALRSLSLDIASGELSSADELAPSQGAIIRSGLKKIAAYRDPKGHCTCTRQQPAPS